MTEVILRACELNIFVLHMPGGLQKSIKYEAVALVARRLLICLNGQCSTAETLRT